MDLKDLSAYLTGLLRGEPEVIAAFFMGVLLSGMLAFWLRHRPFPGYEVGLEFARRDAEIARRDTELVRKDSQLAVFEAKMAILEARLADEERLVASSRRQGLIDPPPAGSSPGERLAAMEATCAELDAQNRALRQDKQSGDAEVADLRAKLAQAIDEANHWAKWAKVHEENAQLAAAGSPADG